MSRERKIPNPTSWFRKSQRTRLINQYPDVINIQLTFETAAAEVLSIQEDGLPMPQEHLDVLKKAFIKSFLPIPETEKKSSIASYLTIGNWLGPRRPKSPPDEIEELWRAAYFPYDDFYYYYRSIKYALWINVLNARDSERIRMACNEATRLAYRFFDWAEQTGTLESLLSIYHEFGETTELEELRVCNDWLEERMMSPLLFPQLVN